MRWRCWGARQVMWWNRIGVRRLWKERLTRRRGRSAATGFGWVGFLGGVKPFPV